MVIPLKNIYTETNASAAPTNKKNVGLPHFHNMISCEKHDKMT